MTRKDYILISSGIKVALNDPASDRLTVRNVAYIICNQLQLDNMRFDAKKFMEACGFKD